MPFSLPDLRADRPRAATAFHRRKKLGIFAVVIGLLVFPDARFASHAVGPVFDSDVLGQRAITYDYTGVRTVPSVPAPGVHPRVYFGADELPGIRSRLASTAVGQEAMKMVRMYTNFLRHGRSIAWDSQPTTYKLMPDGSNRCSNPGLYDRSAVYDQICAGTTTILDTMIDDGTGLYVLASEMSLEAFECLVDDLPTGVGTRPTALAAALDTWATWVQGQADFPGPAGAANGAKLANHHRFGGHHAALTYDLVFNAMTTTQRANVRKALARLMGGYFASDASSTQYTGVGVAPEACATNWVAINSFKLLTACALDGEVTVADAGYSAAQLASWFHDAMGSYHKFLTYGWYASGAPVEGQGKNYLFGAHMVAYARRGYDFFGHPHLRAYAVSWLPAVLQPFGFSTASYDLLGGSGFDTEHGRQQINGLDYIAVKWMFPGDPAVDFAWGNYVRTAYKDGGGNWQSYLDLRDGKFSIRSGYYDMLLPAAIYASDVASTATWTQQNAEGRDLDYLDTEGGTLISRSSQEADATSLLFHVRQDFGGHTFADRNTFTLSALGRIFINYNSGSTNSGLQAAQYHSIVEVDGKSMWVTDKEGDKMRIPAKLAAWSPIGGTAAFATGDATYAYTNEWWWNASSSPTNPPIRSGFTRDYNTHNTFRRAGNKIPEAFGDTPFVSFPHWVNPGTQYEGIQAKSYHPMRQVYRTIGLVRAAKPYALVIDDVRKDDATHTYKWFASLAEDLTIVTGSALPAGADAATDVVLEEPASKGSRRLLVRILRAQGTPVLSTAATAAGSALAYTEVVTNNGETWKRLVIERAAVVAPEYRVLLFPFRSGDPLPATTFVGKTLSVALAGQTDTFTFTPRAATVGGQTVTMNEFTLTRDGSLLLDYRNQIEPTNVRGPAGVPDPLPAAPTGLSATLLSETQVRLNWTDNTPGETHWLVERSPAGAENWVTLASTLPANSVSFIDHTASPSSAYRYRLRSVGLAGFSDFASVTAATPAGIGDGIPGWWRHQHFGNGLTIIPGVSGLNDNPEGDQFPTFGEYALGLDPGRPDRAATTLTKSGPNWVFTCQRPANRPGLHFAVEVSPTLLAGSWVTDGVTYTRAITGDPETWQATYPVGPSRTFFRLKITTAP